MLLFLPQWRILWIFGFLRQFIAVALQTTKTTINQAKKFVK